MAYEIIHVQLRVTLLSSAWIAGIALASRARGERGWKLSHLPMTSVIHTWLMKPPPKPKRPGLGELSG